jgi:diguanylate cyclase (GGDEF)-like protein
MTGSNAAAQTGRAVSVAHLVCVMMVSGVGLWALLSAMTSGNAYELLAFSAVAFASGLARLRVESAVLPVKPFVRISIPVTMAAIPFLGPAASVPAMLASLAYDATNDADDCHPTDILIRALGSSAAGLAGGLAYLLIARAPAGATVPISAAAFVAGIAAFAVVELMAGITTSESASSSRSEVWTYIFAAAIGGLVGLWLQYCPRGVMILSGLTAVGVIGLERRLSRRSRSKTSEISVEPVEATPEQENPSLVDPLTRMANDRYLYLFLRQEIVRSARKNVPISLLILDIDDFDSVNSKQGAQSADSIIMEVGQTLKELIREYDMAARSSSDEFALVLPEANSSDARETAERVRQYIEAHKFDGGVRLRVSVGVATYPEHGLTPDNLISSAHHALNKAKFAGKNQVVSCEEVVSRLKYGT